MDQLLNLLLLLSIELLVFLMLNLFLTHYDRFSMSTKNLNSVES